MISKFLNSSFMINSLFVTLIFSSFNVLLPIKIDPIGYLAIPFIWSIVTIYLSPKKFTFLALNSYAIFLIILLAEKTNFGVPSIATLLSYSSMCLAILFVFVLLFQTYGQKKNYNLLVIMTFLTTLLVSTIPLFFALYALNFDEPLTADALFAIFQTNIYEAYEFVTDYISIQWILAYFVITFFLAFSLIKQEKNEPLKIKPSVISFLIIIFIAITISLKDDLRVFKTVIHGFSNYKEELQLFKETQNQRKNNINFSAVKEQTGETYIVVIGESLNKNHMGVYGYHRNTTPQFTALQNNNELLVFNQAYSNHTHTMPVLSQALTEATQLNNKDYFDSLSIINILKKAGFETYWLTNQNLYG